MSDLDFTVPDELVAAEPPEARGVRRDQVRLLVARPGELRHARFADLAEHLHPGDLVVINTSGTLAAAIDGVRSDGRRVTVHFSTALDDGTWLVEVRPTGTATGPVDDAVAGERITLAGDVRATLLEPHRGQRLWRADVPVEGGVRCLLTRYGRPIRYAYLARDWRLADYQTVFARAAGSAEMPSAGRPFTAELVTALVARGIAVAPVTLHTGVSSLEAGEAPLAEWFDVPAATARLVNATRAVGGRVVAVGTTVTRALESARDAGDRVQPRKGWTELVLGPDVPARVVNGLVTGWHAPGASHLHLLDAVAGPALVRASYDAALAAGYLWHEFGDSCLLLP